MAVAILSGIVSGGYERAEACASVAPTDDWRQIPDVTHRPFFGVKDSGSRH
jgi:hypothetical protein